MITLHSGNCLEVLEEIPENSIDAVVTDPPYELGFMGKSWDASGVAFCPETWAKVLRVMKPGAHLVAFGAPKNYHRLACAIEDAGFELRDSLMWVFGTGFPKSMDVSKAIDKAAGAKREVIGVAGRSGSSRSCMAGDFAGGDYMETIAATDAARQWEGWGTALKPAYEPIVLARKPLSEKTVAANVLRWGTGALNIDATRIEGEPVTIGMSLAHRGGKYAAGEGGRGTSESYVNNKGRWPANLCHDGSQGVLELFPQAKKSFIASSSTPNQTRNSMGKFKDGYTHGPRGYLDEGSAARFFKSCPYGDDEWPGQNSRLYYSAKASKEDRAGSKHPTVKPVKLMQWLVRIVTPPGGTVLDPFAGSGTTGHAAMLEGFKATLIEREEEYAADIKRRLNLY